MEYIIKNTGSGKIEHFCSDCVVLPKGAIEVSDWPGVAGEPNEYYDPEGNRYTDEELLVKGLLEDHRGTYYNANHQSREITMIGIKPDGEWTTTAPGHWSDKLVDGAWVIDQAARDKEVRELEIRQLSSYLSSTDWYVIRQQESGKKAPAEVLTARASARERISELREL